MRYPANKAWMTGRWKNRQDQSIIMSSQLFKVWVKVREKKTQTITAVGTRPWTNRFVSAITTIVSSSSQSHMVDPDWIQIFNLKRKATPTCVKGKVTLNVMCQCSKNSYFWPVIDHKYQAPCWVVLTSTYIFRSI